MKLTVTQFMTLDGVIQSPIARDEDNSEGFDLGGWLPPHFDESVGAYVAGIFDQADEFLLGGRTYDEMVAYWPMQTPPEGRDRVELNDLPKHVVTSRTEELAWEGAVRLDRGVPKAVAELKRKPGRELQVHGSARLVRSLIAADLIDTYRLLVCPTVLGRGRRLFADGTSPVGLRLTDSRISASGVAMMTYEAAGRPAYVSPVDATQTA